MKTGKVAILLDIDQGTVKNWIRAVPAFFSDAAQNKGRMQRDLDNADVITLNTIRVLRSQGTLDWTEISRFLQEGKRFEELPVTAITADTGESTLVQVQKALAMSAQLESAMERVGELEDRIETLETQLSNEQQHSTELTEKMHQLEIQHAVAKALYEQELDFWRTGRLRVQE